MLKSLTIVNYALINNLEIQFSDGFTAITGETGAGKSIIIGALSLILGGRADLNVFRDNTKKCVIEGTFDNRNDKLETLFLNNDLDYDREIIIRRELLPSGKSRAFINDTPVNLKLMANLGNNLVNIHSQHQTLELSNNMFQLDVIDDYSDNRKLLQKYIVDYKNYKSLLTRMTSLEELNKEAVKNADFYNFQLDELVSANLNPDDIAGLESRARILDNYEEINTALSEADSILNNDESSVLSNVSRLVRVIGKAKPYLSSAEELTQRLESVVIELEDVSSEIQSLNDIDDFDPIELETINNRLSSVYSLLKKHNVIDVSELIELQNDFEQKLSSIQNLDQEIIDIKSKIEVSEKFLVQMADSLHELRVKGSKKFSKSVLSIIHQLGMKDAGFAVSFERLTILSETGVDKIKFMFNANLGGTPGEISKIASGGELSRVMLAVKSLISKKQMMPTVIFDEIDSGVSGDIAGKVAKILHHMSKAHQVMSITHLPQIAAKADHHFRVFKTIENNSTITSVKKLYDEERVEELAAIMSNEKITQTALNVARELMLD